MMAKTDWQMDDTVQPADLNQIGQEINKNTSDISNIQQEIEHLDLSAENVTLDSPDFQSKNVKDGMQELFTNVDNGKNEVAAAIVDMNQPASGSDTFPELAQKIRDISSDATATAGDILSGQDAYARGVKIIGTRVRRTGHVNAQSISRSGTTLRLRPQAGDYDGTSGNSVQFSDPNWIANNIRQGVSIFCLAGNLIEGKRWATGSVTSSGVTDILDFTMDSSGTTGRRNYVQVTGLTFNPSLIILITIGNSIASGYSITYLSPVNFSYVGSTNSRILMQRVNDPFFYRLESPAHNNNGFLLPSPFSNTNYSYYAFE